MTERQAKLLIYIVKEYIRSGEPVSSSILFNEYEDRISTATIRTEMYELEEDGYLRQPHISSGRIPTEKAYQYFVRQLDLDNLGLSSEKSKSIFDDIEEDFFADAEEFIKESTKRLARLTHSLVINEFFDKSFASGFEYLFQRPEFRYEKQRKNLAHFLDHLEESLDTLFSHLQSDFSVFIGKENPVKEMKDDFSVLVSKIPKHKIVTAVVGPQRIPYDKNIGYLAAWRRVLEEEDEI